MSAARMRQGFVIMQIGNDELDRMYERAIVPALRACGLTPRRVDKHNQGGLLHSEIISFLEESEMIVADLTNERPNCYLEVGYALGAGRFSNLILTAREDHNPDSVNHRPAGPKVRDSRTNSAKPATSPTRRAPVSHAALESMVENELRGWVGFATDRGA